MALTQEFYVKNRQKLMAAMVEDSMAIIYSGRAVQQSLDADYPFYTDNNFYYLTGIEEEHVALILTKDSHGETNASLFIDRADPVKEKWVGRKITKEEAEYLSGVTAIAYNDTLEKWLVQGKKYQHLYFDFSAPRHQSFSVGDDAAKKVLSSMELLDIKPLIAAMRIIKQPEEIQAIKGALEVTHQGINAILENLRPGIKEYEMAALFEYTIQLGGAQGTSFQTIAASGKNATILHYVKNQAMLQPDTLVLFDLGARLGGYCGDISRTYPVSGHYTKRQAQIYEIVLNAQKALIKDYVVGARMKDIQAKTREIFLEECLSAGIVPENKDISQYYYHGIGHSLGLDTHDTSGDREYILEPGMIVTCEPGLYIEELAIGVRIEDDILVTAEGPEILHDGIPKEIDEIEKIMNA